MKTIRRRRWRRWLATLLVVVLILAIALPLRLNWISMEVSWEPSPAYAVGVTSANVTLTGQNTTADTTYVQFDLGWNKSWRDLVNWDAVWVFVKYSVSDGDWAHATLATSGHSVTTDNGVAATIDVGLTGGAGMGVFMYRNAPGAGTINWDGVKLKWQYGTDTVADDALVRVKVFAIEMVYVPQGAFWVGDADNDMLGSFRKGGTTQPFQITSEDAITVADTATNLYYDNSGQTYIGDQDGPIPAPFPKGYDAFYIMKHEASQRQYAEFLNTLTASQATTRASSVVGVGSRSRLELRNGVYGSDVNGNNTLNEATDGEWIRMGWVAAYDIAAYADWAGLRFYTELEFEKAARGTAAVVDDEYAWGNNQIASQPYTLTSADTASEAIFTNYATDPVGNASYLTTYNATLRVGIFATATSTRAEAGASYYGVLSLSGSGFEKIVSVGHIDGRGFTGTHGDGTLSANGYATNSDWPGYSSGEVTDSAGYGFRGGHMTYAASYCTIADRGRAAYDQNSLPYNAMRLARTAP